MNRATIVLVTVALAGLSIGPLAMAHGGAHEDVAVRDNEFEPAILTIEVGTKVTWTNEGPTAHSVATHYHGAVPVHAGTAVNTEDPTAEADDFHKTLLPFDDPATPEDDRTFSWTFETPGLYIINCNLGGEHEVMKQVILVQGH